MNRKEFAQQYLFGLVVQYEALEKERQQLLAAAARITAIQAEKADLIADAQEALTKYNALHGTSYTLPQVRAWYDRTTAVMTKPPPTVAVPDVVGLTQAEAATAIAGANLVMDAATTNSDTVAVDLVISQVPAAGVQSPLQAFVSVVVSLGPVVEPPVTP